MAPSCQITHHNFSNNLLLLLLGKELGLIHSASVTRSASSSLQRQFYLILFAEVDCARLFASSH